MCLFPLHKEALLMSRMQHDSAQKALTDRLLDPTAAPSSPWESPTPHNDSLLTPPRGKRIDLLFDATTNPPSFRAEIQVLVKDYL